MDNTITSANALEPAASASGPADMGDAAIRDGSWLPRAAAALLGALIIAAVGFAPGIAHLAGHDVRHTMVYPCH